MQHPEINIPTHFVFGDLFELECLAGVTVLYLFDSAYEKVNYQNLSDKVHASKSVKYIISNMKSTFLTSNGFDLQEIDHFTGKISGSSESSSRKFIIYKQASYDKSAATISSHQDWFEIAANRWKYQFIVDL